MVDPEAKAMGQIIEALQALDESAQSRVLRWASDRFGVRRTAADDHKLDASPPDEQAYSDLATLYDAAGAQSQGEKALVVGYWLQVIGGEEDWESQDVNTELKNLGHGLKNVTDALNSVINQTPRLVIQTKKSGTSKQARKRYKVTIEGIKRVKAMLSQGRSAMRSKDVE